MPIRQARTLDPYHKTLLLSYLVYLYYWEARYCLACWIKDNLLLN